MIRLEFLMRSTREELGWTWIADLSEGLGNKGYGIWITDYGLRITDYGLRNMKCYKENRIRDQVVELIVYLQANKSLMYF